MTFKVCVVELNAALARAEVIVLLVLNATRMPLEVVPLAGGHGDRTVVGKAHGPWALVSLAAPSLIVAPAVPVWPAK